MEDLKIESLETDIPDNGLFIGGKAGHLFYEGKDWRFARHKCRDAPAFSGQMRGNGGNPPLQTKSLPVKNELHLLMDHSIIRESGM